MPAFGIHAYGFDEGCRQQRIGGQRTQDFQCLVRPFPFSVQTKAIQSGFADADKGVCRCDHQQKQKEQNGTCPEQIPPAFLIGVKIPPAVSGQAEGRKQHDKDEKQPLPFGTEGGKGVQGRCPAVKGFKDNGQGKIPGHISVHQKDEGRRDQGE